MKENKSTTTANFERLYNSLSLTDKKLIDLCAISLVNLLQSVQQAKSNENNNE